MLIAFLCLIGCESKFLCGYDPNLFKITDVFSINNEHVAISSSDLVDKINQFGLDNGFCIANKSRFESENKFFPHIRIVHHDYSFYIYGTNQLIISLDRKESNIFQEEDEVNAFCDLIKPYVDVDKVTYYEDTGNLCDFN